MLPRYHYRLKIHPLDWHSFFFQRNGVKQFRLVFLCFTLDKSFYAI